MADCDFIYQVHPFVRHQIWSGYASLLTMPKLETDINNRPKKNRVSIHIIFSIILGLRIKKLNFFSILSKSNLKNSNWSFFCALTILSTIRDLLTIAVRDNWSISTHSNVVINRLKMCNSDFMTKVYSLHTSITWKLLLNCTIGFLHPDERWKVTLALFCFLWSDSPLFDIILWIC